MAPRTKEEREAARADRKAKKAGLASGDSLASSTQKLKLSDSTIVEKLTNNRSCTGVLTSQKDSRDIKVRTTCCSISRLNYILFHFSLKFSSMNLQSNSILAVVTDSWGLMVRANLPF